MLQKNVFGSKPQLDWQKPSEMITYAVIPLSNKLGAMVITRIPYCARSRVRGSVKEAKAPLDAE